MKSTVNGIWRLVLPAVVVVCVGPVWAAPGDVKASFEGPCKYPSGLASDGKHLFVADWREAKIFEISRADGNVTRTWDAPTLKPHGLTYAQVAKLLGLKEDYARKLGCGLQKRVRPNLAAQIEERSGGEIRKEELVFGESAA